MDYWKYTENFELVLYFSRRVAVKPSEPVFEELQKSNPALDTDSLLDIYSDLKNKYKVDLVKYEKLKNATLVTDYIRIPEDEDFIDNVKAFEKNDFFVEWSKSSKALIDKTLVQMIR
jgi:hypothetical protein